VLGAGVEGLAAVSYFLDNGFTDVVLFDEKNVINNEELIINNRCIVSRGLPVAVGDVGNMRLYINFFPDEKEEAVSQKLDSLMQTHGKKQLVGILDMLLPRSLASVIAARAGVGADERAARISREQRKKILEMLCRFPLTIVNRSSGDEFVTAGGVDLAEVDPKTMQSKICPGLYFAGEILDVDGFTGGFNLQAAWCTGKVAGENSVEN